MARKPRIEYEGAVYHITSRGDRREPIFLDRLDREVFLGCVGEVCQKAGWIMHAYVLMGNHFHMLLETPEANLVGGMKWLLGCENQIADLVYLCFGIREIRKDLPANDYGSILKVLVSLL